MRRSFALVRPVVAAVTLTVGGVALTAVAVAAPAPAAPSVPATATPAAPSVPATPVDRARAALAPFKASLRTTLLQGLEQGPVPAIEACAVAAPALAAAANAGGGGVTVGRTALKLRNPQNTAPAWVAGPLAELAAAPPKEGDHRVVALPGGGTGYVETILTGEPCVKCHGGTISPEITSLLAKRYPEDAARGFALGSFRGVFWAEVAPPR
jgi:hypothetical protein